MTSAALGRDEGRPTWDGATSAPTLEEDADDVATVLLRVEGMKCGGCQANVRKTILNANANASEPSRGIARASVNLVTGTAAVTFESPPHASSSSSSASASIAAAVAKICAALDQKGFKATVRSQDEKEPEEFGDASGSEDWKDVRDLVLCSGLLLLCSAGHLGTHVIPTWGGFAASGHHHHAGATSAAAGVKAALALAALALPGREVIQDGIKALFIGRSPNMNTLVSLGVFASLGMGAMQPLVDQAATLSSSMPLALMGSDHMLEEPVMLLCVILLGKLLEKRARKKSSAELSKLSSLIPKKANLRITDVNADADEGEEAYVSVATDAIRAGDVVKVLPGDVVPVDGVLIRGAVECDQSVINGEANLVLKQTGDTISAGSVSFPTTASASSSGKGGGGGSIRFAPILIEATSDGSASSVKQMRRLLLDAQSREAPVQRLADAICGPFVYTILSTAAATFLFWKYIGFGLFLNIGGDAASATMAASTLAGLRFAVDVLVVACPCALGLATPVCVLVGSSVALRNQILLRGGDVIESLAKVDAIVVDKTGTVTRGRMKVKAFASSSDSPAKGEEEQAKKRKLFEVASVLEDKVAANHPVKVAILDCVNRDGATSAPTLEELDYETGKGLCARLDGELVAMGKLEYVLAKVNPDKFGLGDAPESALVAREHAKWVDRLTSSSNGGGIDGRETFVYVASERLVADEKDNTNTAGAGAWDDGSSRLGVLGCFAIEDEIRSDAKPFLSQFLTPGAAKEVYMLSGDRSEVVQRVAQDLGIDSSNAFGDMSPFDKADFIKKLQEEERGLVSNENGSQRNAKKKKRNVLFIGDGVNDALALSQADVGLAVAKEINAAADAADVVVMDKTQTGESENAVSIFTQVSRAMHISEVTFTKIKQNLTWALMYNVVSVPLAMGCFVPAFKLALDPAIAGAMMASSSLLVVMNSISIYRIDAKGKKFNSDSATTGRDQTNRREQTSSVLSQQTSL